MENLGGSCVFASEIDAHARAVYENNFGILPYGDITLIDGKEGPAHNVWGAGFPCQ